MIYEDLTFDDFMSYDHKQRKEILNDPDALREMVRKNLKPSRFEHSLSVADQCMKLAIRHHVDPLKAYTAGILHDCTKYFSEQEHDSYLRYYDPEKMDYPLACKHSFSAKFYLREKLNFHDKDILNAIYNHTICTSRDRLSIILYIADKREPLRGIEDDILRIAYKDLYKAFDLLRWDVERYLKETKNERFIKDSL